MPLRVTVSESTRARNVPCSPELERECMAYVRAHLSGRDLRNFRLVRDHVQRFGTSVVFAHFLRVGEMTFDGSNHHVIRMACVHCRALLLRYRVQQP